MSSPVFRQIARTGAIVRHLGLAALMACIAIQGADASDLFKWVQYVPGGLEARAVTDAASCPAATIDGAAASMNERSTPGENFPVRGCVLQIPSTAKLLTIAGVPMPLPKAKPNKILLIGDTGCRLKGKQVQSCNDMSEWPFRLGADMSTQFKPDLVLHVGDMHYRESACPIGNLGCAGTPFGDSWEVWKADFFAPGDSLLAAAPWIMVRGNHEECERGGKGWARLLDSYAFDSSSGAAGCLGPQKPYTVDIGGVTVFVMDVSTASEKVNATQVEWYRPQFEAASSIPGPVWLTFHRPIWAADSLKKGVFTGDNKTLAVAARHSIGPNVQMMLSGHHHTFEIMSYVQDLPVQVVSGHGGDDLSPIAPTTVKGIKMEDVEVKDGIGRPKVFGFSMMERNEADPSGKSWKLTGYDTHGQVIGACAIEGRNLRCD